MISRRRIRQIIKESLGGHSRASSWLGDWYDSAGGYYKDADCFYHLDKALQQGVITMEDCMAVCEDVDRYGYSTLEDLKQAAVSAGDESYFDQEWKEIYASSDALQDLFYEVHDFRQQEEGLKYPPAHGPNSRWVGGPAFVTAAWCISIC